MSLNYFRGPLLMNTPCRLALVRIIFVWLLFLLAMAPSSWSQNNDAASERQRLARIQKLIETLEPLHQKMPPVKRGDWLEAHPEKGQNFQEYKRSNPIALSSTRNVLYVLPLGDFNDSQQKIVELSSEFLGIYFGCRVQTLKTLSIDDVIPEDARRIHPTWQVPQIKSTFVLEKLLPPLVPNDAVALICFTTSDLYPSDDWNFVFGQATYRTRVGVWSMYRNGDPDTEFDLCLKRTLRTATHETGHMFSMPHCIAYQCNMCGSNSLQEADRWPLHLCPECVAKVIWSTRCDPAIRFKKLRDFCRENSLNEEANYYSKALNAMADGER